MILTRDQVNLSIGVDNMNLIVTRRAETSVKMSF